MAIRLLHYMVCGRKTPHGGQIRAWGSSRKKSWRRTAHSFPREVTGSKSEWLLVGLAAWQEQRMLLSHAGWRFFTEITRVILHLRSLKISLTVADWGRTALLPADMVNASDSVSLA